MRVCGGKRLGNKTRQRDGQQDPDGLQLLTCWTVLGGKKMGHFMLRLASVPRTPATSRDFQGPHCFRKWMQLDMPNQDLQSDLLRSQDEVT